MKANPISSMFRARHRLLRSSTSSNANASSVTNFIIKLNIGNEGFYRYYEDDNAIAISNNRIVVAAVGYDDGRGKVILFGDPDDPQSGRSYSQLAILTASDGRAGEQFGNSVAIDGDVIAVGASHVLYGVGVVYVYRIIDGNDFISVSEVAKLMPSNGGIYDQFGTTVAIHGNYILAGAPFVDRNTNIDVGSAYLFRQTYNDSDTHEWTQIQQFQPNILKEVNSFGISVALDEKIAVVGGYGGAYVFAPVDYDESVNASTLSRTWTELAKLTGSMDAFFGVPVAVAGNWIMVYEFLDVGAILVFSNVAPSASWTQTTQLLAADGAADDYFGTSISISKDASAVVVTASGHDFNTSVTDSGAVYLFQTTNDSNSSTTAMVTWSQVGIFVASDSETNDFLGNSIAIENSTVVVGCESEVYVVGKESGFSPWKAASEPMTTAPTPTPKPTVLPNVSCETDKSWWTPSAILGILALFVVGGLSALIVILHYRYRMQREARGQYRYRIQRETRGQQHEEAIDNGGSILPSIQPSSSGNIPVALPAAEETITMTDVGLIPPGRTVLGPTTASASQLNVVSNPSEKELPVYKDQVRTGGESPEPSINMISSPAPKSNGHQQDQDPQERQQHHEEEDKPP